MCSAAGAEMLSEPGPKPNRTRRYAEMTYCNTSLFAVVHSWTNGDGPAPHNEPATTSPPLPHCHRHMKCCVVSDQTPLPNGHSSCTRLTTKVPSWTCRGMKTERAAPHAGMVHQPAHNTVLAPQKAVNMSAAVLKRLTGRTSPDIILIASCLWCAGAGRQPPRHVLTSL